MAALNATIPVTYDEEILNIPVICDQQALKAWNDLFGDSLTMRISSQIIHLLRKTPANAEGISLQFSGDISTITAQDVANRTAHVTANAMIEARQTLLGKIRTLLRRLFKIQRGKRQSRAAEQSIRHVIICSFVVVPQEEKVVVDNES